MKHFDTIRADQWTKAFQREVNAGNVIVYQEKITSVEKAQDSEYDHYYYQTDISSGEIWVNHQEPLKCYWRDTAVKIDDKDARIAELERLVQKYEYQIAEAIEELGG